MLTPAADVLNDSASIRSHDAPPEMGVGVGLDVAVGVGPAVGVRVGVDVSVAVAIAPPAFHSSMPLTLAVPPEVAILIVPSVRLTVYGPSRRHVPTVPLL
jgi:hypothetical protein